MPPPLSEILNTPLEWRYFRLHQIQVGGRPPSWIISNGHISATAHSIDLYSAHRAVIFAIAQLSCKLTSEVKRGVSLYFLEDFPSAKRLVSAFCRSCVHQCHRYSVFLSRRLVLIGTICLSFRTTSQASRCNHALRRHVL